MTAPTHLSYDLLRIVSRFLPRENTPQAQRVNRLWETAFNPNSIDLNSGGALLQECLPLQTFLNQSLSGLRQRLDPD